MNAMNATQDNPHYRAILRQRARISELEETHAARKAAADDARKKLRAAWRALDELLRGQYQPGLFDDQEETAEAPEVKKDFQPKREVKKETSTPARPRKSPTAADIEAWKRVSVADLGLPAAIARALIEAGLETLGLLDAFTDEAELTAIRGIGPAAARRVDAALDAFFDDGRP